MASFRFQYGYPEADSIIGYFFFIWFMVYLTCSESKFYFIKGNISQGGKILTGGSVIESKGNFVQPTIVEISPTADIVKEELFAPVLYVMKFQVFSSLQVVFLWWVLKQIEYFQDRNYLFVVMSCLRHTPYFNI